jgi:catechol 2,3-dioxygenase-like lactoylglutathione lyase family enzyme
LCIVIEPISILLADKRLCEFSYILTFKWNKKMKPVNSNDITQGVHHVGLTVTNLDEARHFFINTLRYQHVGDKPDYPAAILSDGTTLITLWQASDPTKVVGFDRKNGVGLHHLALAVTGDAALDSLYQDLSKDTRVKIEFAPTLIGDGPKRHMMCNIPGGGIRVEFIAL